MQTYIDIHKNANKTDFKKFSFQITLKLKRGLNQETSSKQIGRSPQPARLNFDHHGSMIIIDDQ